MTFCTIVSKKKQAPTLTFKGIEKYPFTKKKRVKKNGRNMPYSQRQGSKYWKTPTPTPPGGRNISQVIWGKKICKGKQKKGENAKKKEERGKIKWKRIEKEKMGR
jgi:hypothetical protein